MRNGTKAKFRHYASDGSLLWASDGRNPGESFESGEVFRGSPAELEVIRSQLWTPNALADEGEIDILDVYLDDVAVRTELFGRLYNDTPIETDTLATLASEVTGTGYGSVTFTRGTDWPQPALDAGDAKTTSVVKTYTAGGAWTAATALVLATVTSGTAGLFIAWIMLSTTRTLALDETLDVTIGVKLA